MNEAEYFARLIRPDLAMLREPRKRSICEDERLRQALIRAPMPVADAEWFAEFALEWTHDYVLPVGHAANHQPQQARETLERLYGDCDDGAILLATMLVSALQPEAWPLFKFCVGRLKLSTDRNWMRDHAFVVMDHKHLGGEALLDWTLSPRPLAAGEAEWMVESSMELGKDNNGEG